MNDVMDLAQAVKAAHREIVRRTNEAVRPLGLTAVQAEAILVIADGEPLAVRDLGERIVAESGQPSRLVDRLVAAGYVDRRVSADDRRRVELTLSERGRDLVPQVLAARDRMLARAAADLSGHDLAPATAALRQLLVTETDR